MDLVSKQYLSTLIYWIIQALIFLPIVIASLRQSDKEDFISDLRRRWIVEHDEKGKEVLFSFQERERKKLRRWLKIAAFVCPAIAIGFTCLGGFPFKPGQYFTLFGTIAILYPILWLQWRKLKDDE